MNQALRSLQEARGELSNEAQWLRREFSPGRVAHRAVDNHTTGVLCTAFAAGLVVAWMVFHSRGKKSQPHPPQVQRQPAAWQHAAGQNFMSTLAKAAIPLALKLATSKPVLARIMEFARSGRARSARHTVAT